MSGTCCAAIVANATATTRSKFVPHVRPPAVLMPARAATPLNGRLDIPAWLSSPTPVLSSGLRGSERDKPMPARQARSSAPFVSTRARAWP